MEEALRLIESSKIYKLIFKEIYNKYKKYGRITGSFTIVPKSEEDIEVLLNFDSRVIYDKKAKIKSTVVEELFQRKLNKASFIELLEKVIGEELLTNKEIKIEVEKKQKIFLEQIQERALEGQGLLWFQVLKNEKKYGYKTVIKKFKECENNLQVERLINEIILVINSLNNIPRNYNSHENIAVFAAKNTKDPHFLDIKNYTGKLFVSGIKYILNKEEAESILEINEVYYEAGILKDEISNNTTIFGFKAYNAFNNEIKPINFFTEWNEPLQISVSNLVKIKYLEAINNIIYVFENPAVFNEVLRRTEHKVSLICTSGQLNLSSYIIFDKIKNLEKIYYAGDFDPEGILIADNIKNRYKDKVEFLEYTRNKYEAIISEKEIDSSRLNKLNNIKSLELKEIKEAVKENKRAAYQELMIEDYLKIIRYNH